MAKHAESRHMVADSAMEMSWDDIPQATVLKPTGIAEVIGWSHHHGTMYRPALVLTVDQGIHTNGVNKSDHTSSEATGKANKRIWLPSLYDPKAPAPSI
jgi:hypothetical protein